MVNPVTNHKDMTKPPNSADLAGTTGTIDSRQPGNHWQIFWWVVLLVALIGLVYLHYRPHWNERVGMLFGMGRVPILWIFGVAALLALLALFWSVNRQIRHRGDFYSHRTSRLLDTIRAFCGTAPISQWRVGHDAQIAEIDRIAEAIRSLSDDLSRIDQPTSQCAERVRNSAATAKQGATAIQNAIAGINNTRNRIHASAEQLKQLAQSTRQFNETVGMIRDVTEQTSVLSINASLRGGMLGAQASEAAEEMRRLADRTARAADTIEQQVRAMQSDADELVSSLQITATDVAVGITPAEEAGRALGEIQSASQALLTLIEQAASEAAAGAVRAQSVGENIGQHRTTVTQSGAQASQVADGIEKLKATADSLPPEW